MPATVGLKSLRERKGETMNQDYKEAICKASDTIGFLVRELQDVHSNAPNVGTEMIVLDVSIPFSSGQ